MDEDSFDAQEKGVDGKGRAETRVVVVVCRAKWAERVGVTESGSRRAFDPMCSGDGAGRAETGGLAGWRMGPRPRSEGARRGWCWRRATGDGGCRGRGAGVVLDLGSPWLAGRAWLGIRALTRRKCVVFTRMSGRRSWNNPANSDRKADKPLAAISAESRNITKLHEGVDASVP